MNRKVEKGLEQLLTHPFTQRVFEDWRSVYRAIGAPRTMLNKEFIQEPDEYQFYILKTGNSIAHLLETFRQLEDTILYLSSFSPSIRMKRAGINRHSYLLYTIENFIIRTSTLYDRSLKLVDAVFHLGNAPRECRYNTILNNIHVKRTGVPNRMRELRRVVDKHSQDRNLIVHHEEYQDSQLRELEMLSLLQREIELARENPSKRFQNLPELTKERIREVVRAKTSEFEEFDREMFNQSVDLLSELEGEYLRQKARLLRLCEIGEN